MPLETYSVEISADIRKFNQALTRAVAALNNLAETANKATRGINANLNTVASNVNRVSERTIVTTKTTDRSTKKQVSFWRRIIDVVKKINRFLAYMEKRPEFIEKELVKPVRGFYHLLRAVEIVIRMVDVLGMRIVRAFVKAIPISEKWQYIIMRNAKFIFKNLDAFKEFVVDVRKGTADMIWLTEQHTRRYFDLIDVLVALRDMVNTVAKYFKVSAIAIGATITTGMGIYALARAVGMTGEQMGVFGRIMDGVFEAMRGAMPYIDATSARLMALGRHSARVTTGFRVLWSSLDTVVEGFKIARYMLRLNVRTWQEMMDVIVGAYEEMEMTRSRSEALRLAQETLRRQLGEVTKTQIRMAESLIRVRENLAIAGEQTLKFVRNVILLIRNNILSIRSFEDLRRVVIAIAAQIGLASTKLAEMVRAAMMPFISRSVLMLRYLVGMRDALGGVSVATASFSTILEELGRILLYIVRNPGAAFMSTMRFLRDISVRTAESFSIFTKSVISSGVEVLRASRIGAVLREGFRLLFGSVDRTVDSFTRFGAGSRALVRASGKAIENLHHMHLGTLGLIDVFAKLTLRISVVGFVMGGFGKILRDTRIRIVETFGAIMEFVGIALVKLQAMMIKVIHTSGKFLEVVGVQMIKRAKGLLFAFLETESATFRLNAAVDVLNHMVPQAAASVGAFQDLIKELALTTEFSRTEIMAATSVLIDLAAAAGFGTKETMELLRISVDLASMFGDLQGTVFAVTGAFRGITRSLDKYGISMRDSVVAHKMLGAAGESLWRTMTWEEKQRIRLNYLIKKTEAMRGMAQKRVETMTAAIKSLNATWDESNRIAGEGIAFVLKPFTVVLAKLNRLVVNAASVFTPLVGVLTGTFGIVTYLIGAFVRWSTTLVTILGTYKLVNLVLEKFIPLISKVLGKFVIGQKIISYVTGELGKFSIRWGSASELMITTLKAIPKLFWSLLKSVQSFAIAGVKSLLSWLSTVLIGRENVELFGKGISLLGASFKELKRAIVLTITSALEFNVRTQSSIGISGSLSRSLGLLAMSFKTLAKVAWGTIKTLFPIMKWGIYAGIIYAVTSAAGSLSEDLKKVRERFKEVDEEGKKVSETLRSKIGVDIEYVEGFFRVFWKTVKRVAQILIVALGTALVGVSELLLYAASIVVRVIQGFVRLIEVISIVGIFLPKLSEKVGQLGSSLWEMAGTMGETRKAMWENIKLLWKDIYDYSDKVEESVDRVSDDFERLKEANDRLTAKIKENTKTLTENIEKLKETHFALVTGIRDANELRILMTANNLLRKKANELQMELSEIIRRTNIDEETRIELTEDMNSLLAVMNRDWTKFYDIMKLVNRIMLISRKQFDIHKTALSKVAIGTGDNIRAKRDFAKAVLLAMKELRGLTGAIEENLKTLEDQYLEIKSITVANEEMRREQRLRTKLEEDIRRAMEESTKAVREAKLSIDDYLFAADKQMKLEVDIAKALESTNRIRKKAREENLKLEESSRRNLAVTEANIKTATTIRTRLKEFVDIGKSTEEQLKKLSEFMKKYKDETDKTSESKYKLAEQTYIERKSLIDTRIEFMRNLRRHLESLKIDEKRLAAMDRIIAGYEKERDSIIAEMPLIIDRLKKQEQLEKLQNRLNAAQVRYKLYLEAARKGLIKYTEVIPIAQQYTKLLKEATKGTSDESIKYKLRLAEVSEEIKNLMPKQVSLTEAFLSGIGVNKQAAETVRSLGENMKRDLIEMAMFPLREIISDTNRDWTEFMTNMAARWVEMMAVLAFEALLDTIIRFAKGLKAAEKGWEGYGETAVGTLKGVLGLMGEVAAVAPAAGGGITGGEIAGFQKGAVIKSPTLAMIAETGNPEAIIPLEGGAVPVELRGGQNQVNVNVNIQAIDTQTGYRFLERNKAMISDFIVRSVQARDFLGRSLLREI